ncbi:response regulator [Marisediminicola sp. LYQ134]|uniref:response regulator n=1 Tax=unclassified Marisediminicola TaxID=2618316 RepID=UPI003982E98D
MSEHTSRPRLAVVDDHRLVLDGIVSHLTLTGVEVEVVIAATSWSELLDHDSYPVDVVALDLNLGDNIPVTLKIRALRDAGVRTVVMSGHADRSSVHAVLGAGAHAFVPKTDPAEELVAAVISAAHDLPHRPPEALPPRETAVDPGLGPQEHRALVLYAAGRSIKEVAEVMMTTDETVKSYIKRGRRKYREVGVDVGTKVLLRRRGISEGWLTPE